MANEMRDRLVNLCGNAILSCKTSSCEDCEQYTKNDYPYCMAEYFADHLIENGVVVPPCKKGDTIYFLVGDKLCDGFVKCFDIRMKDNHFVVICETKYNLTGFENFGYWMFGQTVFLTKSEAEQKLKEMRGENDL